MSGVKGYQAMDYTVMAMPERFTTGTDPESTIRRLLWSYPSLFQNRTDALCALFLHYGNGYEWGGGELIEVMGPARPDRASEEVWDDGCRPGLFADLREERDREYAAVRSDIDTAATTHGPLKDKLTSNAYSSRYSYLWNSPDDISPQWASVLAEAKRVLTPLVDAVPAMEAEERREALRGERIRLLARLAEIDSELVDRLDGAS